MSPILESDEGFHIVRVLERQEAGRKPFTDVQARYSRQAQGGAVPSRHRANI